MIEKILYIGLGGALGSVMRYLTSGWFYRYSDGIFPLGTLGVNLIGSFIIGLLWGIFENVVVSANVRNFFLVGILGGFTTFSTFTLENFHLLRDGEIKLAFVNIAFSNIAGVALVFVGYFISKGLLGLFK